MYLFLSVNFQISFFFVSLQPNLSIDISPMYYIITIVALLAFELLYFWVAKRLHIVDRPNERSSHHRVALLGAGILFYFAILFYSCTHGFPYPRFLIGATLLAVVCYADDLRPLPSWLRMLVQVVAVVVMMYSSLPTLQIWQTLLTVIVFVAILNVYNFMDGINGMLAAYSLVVLGTFAYMALSIQYFIDIEFLATLFIALLIFTFFNFRTNARCFSGDVGSIVMGLTVVFLLTRYDAAIPDNGENVSYLCFIIVFLADGLLTVAKRFLNGKNIFEAHREHMYETLVNNLHVPHLRVATSYALLQLVINIGYFLVADKNFYTLVVVLLLVLCYGIFFFYCNRRSIETQK